MARHDSSYLGPRAAQPDDGRSVTRNLRNLPVAAPLRSKYLYCNMMYTVAAYLVEVKTGLSFSDYLQKRFFQPLGMASTSPQPGRARSRGLQDRMATGYHWDQADLAYRGFASPDCPEGQGAGSVVSSVNDLIKWVKALTNREGPISDGVYRGLVRARSLPDPDGRRRKAHSSPPVYAAGLEVYYYRGHAVVGHDGCVPGFSSRFFFLPDHGFGAVMLANSAGAAGPLDAAVTRALIDEIVKAPEAERAYWKSVGATTAAAQAASDHSRQVAAEPGSRSRDDEFRKKESRKEKRKEHKAAAKRKERSEFRQTGGLKDRPPQKTPLSAYTGTYSHPGYHAMTVQTKDNKLLIDATDRSTGFNLVFYHVADQTQYTAVLTDPDDGESEQIQAEFVFRGPAAIRMGLHLEPALKELIWFDRVDEN